MEGAKGRAARKAEFEKYHDTFEYVHPLVPNFDGEPILPGHSIIVDAAKKYPNKGRQQVIGRRGVIEQLVIRSPEELYRSPRKQFMEASALGDNIHRIAKELSDELGIRMPVVCIRQAKPL